MFSKVTDFKMCHMIDLNFSKTLYESSTALGFKRSMHIEEGKEVYIIYPCTIIVHITYQMGNMFTFKLVRTLDIENLG